MFAFFAFCLLGIERFVYGFIYQYPNSFKKLCEGSLKAVWLKKKKLYWDVAKEIGIWIKVFQFGVIAYDILWRIGLSVPSTNSLVVGLTLVGAGQVLNVATYNAIGAMGVYYGEQLGYDVPWCHNFPYNFGLGDPQYWGVVLCVWGMYTILAPGLTDVLSGQCLIPFYETFWYIASMKLLEHAGNGTIILRLLSLKSSD